MARGSAVDLEVQQRAATLQVDAVVAVKRAKEQETQKALEQVQVSTEPKADLVVT